MRLKKHGDMDGLSAYYVSFNPAKDNIEANSKKHKQMYPFLA
jgi:hypothetical protein